MAVTRSRAAERPAVRRGARPAVVWRMGELGWMLGASLFVLVGLFLVYRAKNEPLADVEAQIKAKRILNLNALGAREELLPFLSIVGNQREREDLARKIYYQSGSMPNVGRIRPMMTGEQFRVLKPQFVVRAPAQFRSSFRLWAGLFFAAIFAAHAWLSLRGSKADQTLLPAVLTLSGIGLILMASLRDPVRDQLLFADFAQGVVGGCAVLALASGFDYERLFGKMAYVPLLASAALSVLLVLFGSGPGTSDAKVNLFGFQPVEVIRLLLVFFLAGYFASRWDLLRHARETRPKLAKLTSRVDIPPVEYTLPVLASVVLALIFFFLQRDMGPALVFACLFLALYGIARGSAFVPSVGLALVGLGFFVGYLIGVPGTVAGRVGMWLSPWDNLARGGDQVAHSLWAFATGGLTGMGIGLGEPQFVPAGHTDLVLAALGEEWGFLGVFAGFALYGLVVWRASRAALRARSDYEFFLGIGLAAATALQILLIAGGALGVVPLSGVVTPFLSYGKSSMIANFAVIGILLAISSRQGEGRTLPFVAPLKAAGVLVALGALVVVGKAAWVQVARDGATMGEGTLVVQADGGRRYQYNPRINEVIATIPKGTIYDRTGLPLATSDWAELEKHRAAYRAVGVDIDRTCRKTDQRHYPFGGLMFDVLGDLRTRMRWAASNTSFIERDSARRLRGYDERPTLVEVKNPGTGKLERTVRYDYRELLPLVRHRHDPQHPSVRKILDRPRNVTTSIDARLTVRVGDILREQLEKLGKDKGAAVVMDPATGDLLAAVSYPLPPNLGETEREDTDANPYLDRARYGLYPPGSTFKVVTAIAALRKSPQLAKTTYACVRLPDGRVGQFLKGSNRPIRDDVKDAAPHGNVDMERGTAVSCNAYFAQLGTYDVGSDTLHETAELFGISVANPNTAAELKKALAQSAYGQGEVVASPFQMARVAATVANGGMMPQGRWVSDETNSRTGAPVQVLGADLAGTVGRYMRGAVTAGTGRAAAASVPVAGKTGTAELANEQSHAWFIGFAPYGGAKKIAFSVLVENGVYGGTAAAPAASQIVEAAVKLGLTR